MQRAVESYTHALEFDPDCYKPQKMCDNAAYVNPSIIKIVPVYYKTQETVKKLLILVSSFLFWLWLI